MLARLIRVGFQLVYRDFLHLIFGREQQAAEGLDVLIAHPGAVNLGAAQCREQVIAGILAPLFGLRREDDLGIGDVAALREFIDWSAESGFKLVQLLPINETGPDNSP